MKRNKEKLNQRLTKGLEIVVKDEFFEYIPYSRALEKHQISDQQIAKALSCVSRRYRMLVKIIVLNEKEDFPLAIRLANQIENAKAFVVRNENEAVLHLRSAKFIISSRYHGTLLATALGIPALSLSSDPKIQSLCTDYSLYPDLSPRVIENPILLCSKIEKMLNHNAQNSLKIYNSIQKFTAEAEKYINDVLIKSIYVESKPLVHFNSREVQ